MKKTLSGVSSVSCTFSIRSLTVDFFAKVLGKFSRIGKGFHKMSQIRDLILSQRTNRHIHRRNSKFNPKIMGLELRSPFSARFSEISRLDNRSPDIILEFTVSPVINMTGCAAGCG